jgi:hypothetical protein
MAPQPTTTHHMQSILLDLRKPLHARAYLLAASYFLSAWPQEWDAETLALALLSDEEDKPARQENKTKIMLWKPIAESVTADGECPHLLTEECIGSLAESFLLFLHENKSENVELE